MRKTLGLLKTKVAIVIALFLVASFATCVFSMQMVDEDAVADSHYEYSIDALLNLGSINVSGDQYCETTETNEVGATVYKRSAAAGSAVEVVPIAPSGYEYVAGSISYVQYSNSGVAIGEPVKIAKNMFTMPSYNIKLNAEFRLKDPQSSYSVYFTLSNDGYFMVGNDSNNTLLAHQKLNVSWFDLKEYGLENYNRVDDDGKIIRVPTLLHAYIVALETYYCPGVSFLSGDNSGAISVTGTTESSYLTTFWGHDENFMYFVNHDFPLMYEGWGATCAWILLDNGMTIDIALFTDWGFNTRGAFAEFDKNILEVYSGDQFKLTLTGDSTNSAVSGNNSNTMILDNQQIVWFKASDAASYSNYSPPEYDRTINPITPWKIVMDYFSYEEFENGDDGSEFFTDERGVASITLYEPGTYYITSAIHYTNSDNTETYNMGGGTSSIASPICVVTVKPQSEYTITFTNYDGSVLQSSKVTYGNEPSYSGTIPTKTSDGGSTYSFSGWSPALSKVSKNQTYVATFTDSNNPVHTVTFDVDGGTKTAPSQQMSVSGKTIVLPAYLGTKNGHTFSGWSDGKGTYDPGSDYVVGDSDITFKAMWESISHSVTYDVNGGSASAPKQDDVVESSSFTVATYSGIKKGHVFDGWSDGNKTYLAGTKYIMSDSNVVLKAVWSPIKHSVVYSLDGGSGNTPTQGDVTEGSLFVVASYSGTKEGHKFSGWGDGNSTYLPGSNYIVGEKDVKLTAVWIKNDAVLFSVSVASNDVSMGAVSGGGEYPKDSKVVIVAIPNDGYTFEKWSDDNTKVSRTIVVENNVSLTATFVKKVITVIETDSMPDKESLVCDLSGSENEISYGVQLSNRMVVDNDVFSGGALTDKKLIFDIKDQDGTIYSWMFDGSGTYNQDASSSLIDLRISGSFSTNDEKLRILAKQVADSCGKENKVFYLNFSASGELPYESIVKYRVGQEYSGESFALYYYNATDIVLESMKSYVVDNDGFVSIVIDHCSDYLLLSDNDVVVSSSIDVTVVIISVVVLLLAIVAVFIFVKRRGDNQ